MADDRHKVRWGRIGVITVAGLAFTGAPFYLANKVNTDFGDDRSLVSSTLTNIGTTILLVGIVFFLERGLLQRVSDTAARTTARVVDERTTDLTSANRALATELADLRAQFERATVTDSAQRTAPLRKVATDVSFDSIAEALETANSFGALQYDNVTVPLVTPSDAPELVTLDWRSHEVRRADGRRMEGSHAPQIGVSYHAKRNPSGGPGVPVVEVLWQPGRPPLDPLMDLRAEMIRRGFGEEAKLVTPDVFEHVGVALRDAVAGRAAEEGAWIKGAMSTWLADGWAITEEGLISRDHGSILTSEFPESDWRTSERIVFDPPAPDGVSEAFWTFAVQHANRQHGRGPTALAVLATAGLGTAPAYTTETSPRHSADWPHGA